MEANVEIVKRCYIYFDVAVPFFELVIDSESVIATRYARYLIVDDSFDDVLQYVLLQKRLRGQNQELIETF